MALSLRWVLNLDHDLSQWKLKRLTKVSADYIKKRNLTDFPAAVCHSTKIDASVHCV